MHLGRLHCLEILVKRTAAGVDFDELVDEGEIEGKEAPEYYRGLSVRGKKRDGWARRGQTATEPDTPPPLLYAAKMGKLESVQWFLGPAAARCYNAFVAGNKNDPGVRKLLLTEKGPANTIRDFLESRCHLLLHSAVIAEENEESLALVEYLANNMRHLLDAKNVDGCKHLELLDSEGDTPCHGRGVISWALIDLLLAYEPELAAKENVNGLTPADVAEQKLFAKAAKPPHIPQQSSSRNLGAGAVGKEPWT
ncbi:hypothetical protein COL922a_013882, partial [Colletotrichum nupharicola]